MLKKVVCFLLIGTLILLMYMSDKMWAREIEDETLYTIIKELQNGGYILYMRHGEATIGQDQADVDFEDCSTQRNLSETGIKQAEMMGVIIKKNDIPLQYPVIASPYCRTRETAEIAFGKQNVEVNPYLANINHLFSEHISNEELDDILDNITKNLETKPPNGKNTVIVGHTFPKDEALGDIPYMGTVVIKPNGEGQGYEIIKKINLNDFNSEH